MSDSATIIQEIRSYSEMIATASNNSRPTNFDKLVKDYLEILLTIRVDAKLAIKHGWSRDKTNIEKIQVLTNAIVETKPKFSINDLLNVKMFFEQYHAALVPDTPSSVVAPSSSSKLMAQPLSSFSELPVVSGYEPMMGFNQAAVDNKVRNKCYQNAALQMFYHIPDFKDFVEQLDITNTTSDGVNAIKSGFEMLSTTKKMGEVASCFSGYGQHDVHDYIQKGIITPFENTPALQSLAVSTIKRNTNLTGKDALDHPTYTESEPTIEYVLTIDFPQKASDTTLNQLIKESLLTQQAGQDSDNTKNEGHYIQTAITIPPANKYLCFWLKRFAQTEGTTNPGTKITDVLPIGDTTIEVFENPLEQDTLQTLHYKLRGFILHIGGGTDGKEKQGGGHYVYYWYNNGEWFIFDDRTAEKVVAPIDQLDNGLIYLYERLPEEKKGGKMKKRKLTKKRRNKKGGKTKKR